MEAVSFLAAVAAVFKLMDLLKYLRAKDVNGAVTLVATYVLAFLAVLLFAQAEIASTWEIPGVAEPLSELDVASLVIVALLLQGSASTLFDFKKAIDRSDSAAVPSLVPPSTGDHVGSSGAGAGE